MSKKLQSGFIVNIKDMEQLKITLSVEEDRTIFNSLLLNKNISIIMNYLRIETLFLQNYMPELLSCIGIKQNIKHHKYDVFTHCVKACENAPQDLTVRLAALFHDIGKMDVVRVEDGKMTFHKHEMYSIRKARTIMRRLEYSEDIINDVLHLIRWHMYFYTKDQTDGAIRRFINNVGIKKEHLNNLNAFPLFQLRIADRLGSGLKSIPITNKQKDFQRRISAVIQSQNNIKLDINGKDLMGAFGLEQSPLIGTILRELSKIVLGNSALNRKIDLLEVAKQILVEFNQSTSSSNSVNWENSIF